jgi:hypothetical protein
LETLADQRSSGSLEALATTSNFKFPAQSTKTAACLTFSRHRTTRACRHSRPATRWPRVSDAAPPEIGSIDEPERQLVGGDVLVLADGAVRLSLYSASIAGKPIGHLLRYTRAKTDQYTYADVVLARWTPADAAAWCGGARRDARVGNRRAGEPAGGSSTHPRWPVGGARSRVLD